MLDDEYHIEARALTPTGEAKFKKQFFPSLDNCVSDDIGNGGFQYVGKHAAKDPKLTMWLMRFYSGLTLADLEGDEISQCMLVTSGPKRVYKSAELAVRFGITT